jgi:hypothetical protein
MPAVTDTVTTLLTSEEYAEITMLCGKYFDMFVLNIINFFFLFSSHRCDEAGALSFSSGSSWWL